MPGFVLFYLIVIVVAIVARSKKAAPKGKQPPPVKPAPESKTNSLNRDEIRRAAQLIMKDFADRPAKAAPTAANTPDAADIDFYQGTSFGDEGVDPCHDDMYEHAPRAAAEPEPQEAPAFALRLTPDNMLNGIIMSEVLKKRE